MFWNADSLPQNSSEDGVDIQPHSNRKWSKPSSSMTYFHDRSTLHSFCRDLLISEIRAVIVCNNHCFFRVLNQKITLHWWRYFLLDFCQNSSRHSSFQGLSDALKILKILQRMRRIDQVFVINSKMYDFYVLWTKISLHAERKKWFFRLQQVFGMFLCLYL